MDILFHDGERFPAFSVLGDEEDNYDSLNDDTFDANAWCYDINGETEFPNIWNEWQDISTTENEPIKQEPAENEPEIEDFFGQNQNLDLCSFINDPLPLINQPIPRAGVKKIDLKAQKYIVEEDDEEETVDIETVSDNEDNPLIEAADIKGLLEKFEATSYGHSSIVPENEQVGIKTESINIKDECMEIEELDLSWIKSEPIDHSAKEASQNASKTNSTRTETAAKAKETKKHKQIADELPQELIKRIKESGSKRKGIALIDPVPAIKKRKCHENNSAKSAKSTIPETIRLDHDYCTTSSPYPKHPKKDSGFESAEEEEKTLRHQPLVKNADGKLMVSLLKVNTINAQQCVPSPVPNETNKKKKLNIEEYKKRRGETALKIKNTNGSQEPKNSNDEDKETIMLKHQEKLKKMSMELLSTPPKSVTVKNPLPVVKTEPKVEPIIQMIVRPTSEETVTRTLVSIGVNTDIINVRDGDALNPVEKIEEIKPILKKAGYDISDTTLFGNMLKTFPKSVKPTSTVPEEKMIEHGEDMTIVHFPKNRVMPASRDAGAQTIISIDTKIESEDNKARYRRRESSASDSSSSVDIRASRKSKKRTSRYSKVASRSSRASSSSSSSSYQSSHPRTSSMSPQRRNKKGKFYDEEYERAVEERRIIFIGKILPSTTVDDLRKRFSRFGKIKSASIHLRADGLTCLDNYGFVTYARQSDAYDAIEHGNDDPYEDQYDISFGGRRLFCDATYSDLDNMREDYMYSPRLDSVPPTPSGESFDDLLKEMQERQKLRKL